MSCFLLLARQMVFGLSLLLVGIGGVSLAGEAGKSGRPNIIYIMSDDHCAQAVGAYGGRLAKLNPTPTIDTLAKEGMLFENCFVTNSICTPSRASIMTGQYSHKNGVYTLNEKLDAGKQHLAIEMKKAGYLTAMIGKWHLKSEPAAFDYYKVLPGQGKYHNPSFRVRGPKAWTKNVVHHQGEHSSDAITDSTLSWLKKRDKTKPFFLMHHFKAPHDMFGHAARYNNYLANVNIPEPASLWKNGKNGSIATRGHNDELIHQLGTSVGRRNHRRNYAKTWARDKKLTDVQAKRQAYQTYLKKYLRCVKGVDDNLKRLFDYLKAAKLYDNTVIIYTGDQGFMLGEHDYIDKRWMYEESQRMPFLIRYPKTIAAGKRSKAIIENVDFPALMLEFAGVKQTPKYMAGRSFKTICETGREPANWRKAAYYRYWMHMAHHDNPSHVGIRTKSHKLIYFYGCSITGGKQTPPGWELYDLSKDPKEMNNVYRDPKYAAVLKTLKVQLKQRRKEIGDTDIEFPKVKAIVEEFWDDTKENRAKAIRISNELAKRKRGK